MQTHTTTKYKRMRWFTCEKKLKTHKNLMNMKPRRIGVINLFLNHFWTTRSLFSNGIQENFLKYGHLSPTHEDPHSKKVPSLLQRILTTSLTTNAPSVNPLFITISATCRYSIECPKAAYQVSNKSY